MIGDKLHWFCDMEKLTGYHPSLRTGGQGLVRANWNRLDTINILVRSKLVQMGVAVANLALEGRLRSFQRRAQFERELQGILGPAR
jgi:hypothetical protein